MTYGLMYLDRIAAFRRHRAVQIMMVIIAALSGWPASVVQGQGITVPRLIDRARVDAMLEQVAASAAQSRDIIVFHDLYLEEWSKSFDEDIIKLGTAWTATYISPDDFTGESMAAQFKETKELADRLRFRLKGANDAFLDQVEFTLAESQLVNMRRFRLAWERFCVKRSMQGVPEKGIDIVALLGAAELGAAELAMVDAYLFDQEPAYVAALQDVAEADERVAILEFELLDVTLPYRGKMLPPPEAERQIVAFRAKAGRLSTSSWTRLVDMNRKILQQSTALLSAESAQVIRQSYAALAYPDVFPDKASAEFLFDSALGFPSLDPTQREALTALRASYQQRHASISAAMCASIYDCEMLIYKRHATNQADAAVQRKETVRLGIQRETLNLSQMATIKGLLSPEQQAELPAFRFKRGKPSRPWDPEAAEAERAADRAEEERLWREQAATQPQMPEDAPQ